MHNAFEIRAVLKQLPVRIESAAAYSDRLLLGTANGALLVYRVAEPVSDKQQPQVTLLETKKAFARRSIEHLNVIKEAGVLVCLADGLVTLYDLHSLSNATPLSNTKGASIVAVHTAVDHIDGIPTLVSKLAVHAKRKVVVLEWRDAEFYKSFEYSAADKITAMQFASLNLLTLATAREFLTLHLPRGQWDDLFPADAASLRTVAGLGLAGIQGANAGGGGRNGGGNVDLAANGAAQPAVTQAPTSSGGGNSGGGMWGSWAIGLSGSTTELKTTIARMPSEKLLLCHETIGVFINSAGKLCYREYTEPMIFARVPTRITYTSSYAIAISLEGSAAPMGTVAGGMQNQSDSKFNVEVRNIATQALVQSLYLAEEAPTNIINGSGGKQVWAIGPHTVWRLMPVPIEQQVEDVLSAGQYDEALSLVAQSDSILESEKEELTLKIRWLRARWLFRDQAKYEEALNEFTDLGATPTEAIAMCPARIAGELAEDEDSDNESQSGDDQDDSDSENNDASSKDDQAPAIAVSGDARKSTSATAQASDTERHQKQIKPKQVIWKEAMYALMRYLTEHRRWLQKAIADSQRDREYVVRVLGQDDGDEEVSENLRGLIQPSGDNDSLFHVRLERLAFTLERMKIPVAAMAQVVDTTLLKVYLECSPGLIGPLLRVKNHCDVEQSEGLLLEHKRYAELVDLYHGKGLFRNALQLLQRLGKTLEHGSLHGTYAIVRYLLRLPADQFELVLEYARWPLQVGMSREQSTRTHAGSDSDSAMDAEDWPSSSSIVSMVFADDRPAAEAFPRSRVSAFLRQMSSGLVVQYLNYVFEMWSDQTAVLHDDMVAAYLDMLASSHSEALVKSESPAAVAIGAAESRFDLRLSLQQFLRASKYYSPERALARLPDNELFEERALVLGRLGRHEHALCLLVFSVANLPLAEQYCVENVEGNVGVFVLLLGILVAAPPPDLVDSEAALIRSGSLFVCESDLHESPDQVEVVRQQMHRQFAGHLLSAHHQNIPAADALRILPLDMEFTPDILEYLRSQLCTLDQDMRSSNLVQNLRIGEDQQVRRQVRRLQSSFVVVSDMRTCPHCLKRIGAGTAFAVIPPQAGIKGAGPSVVHYSCWQRHKSAGMCATGGHDDEDNGDGSSVFSSDEPATPDADDTTKTSSTPGFVIKWA